MEKITDLKLREEKVFKGVKTLILKIKKAIEDFEKPQKTSENTTKVDKEETITGGKSKSSIEYEPSDLTKGINILERLRKDIYEDLNQIPHEAMILRAARSVNSKDFYGDNVEWYWNPRQTGLAEEPDLRGKIAGEIVVSAEVTTSKSPVGTIDKRMASTLKNLNNMPGKKIYFVRTETHGMEKHAKSKVSKCGYQIEVRKI